MLLANGRSGHLPPDLAHHLLLQLLQLLPDANAPQLRLQCLRILLELTQSNPSALLLLGSMVQNGRLHPPHGSVDPQQDSTRPAADIAASSAGAGVVACLKCCLLQPAPSLQMAAARLLSALARHAPPAVAQQLIEADACEYLFELIRGTLNGGAHDAGGGAGGLRSGGDGGSVGAVAAQQAQQDDREALQCCAITALHHLSHQGEQFAACRLWTTSSRVV